MLLRFAERAEGIGEELFARVAFNIATSNRVVGAVRDGWADASEFGRLTRVDRDALWGRQFLNPGIVHGLTTSF